MARAASVVNVPTATAEQALSAPGAVVIDLRSPAEFAGDHVPGAVNVPLFDDAQRAVIGTLYAYASREEAFEEGRRLTRRRVGSLLEGIAAAAGWNVPPADLERRVDELCASGIDALESGLEPVSLEELPERPVVLHCWRGGLRSRSVVALVRALGLTRAVGLEGGYKGYRRWVIAGLARWQAPPAFVLRGFTGVGKTLVLREVERLRPGWTLDLEALACHRSSILGAVGLEPVTQKAFESRLFARLGAGFPGAVVLEGESRKVGDAIIPEGVWRALSGGTNLELVAPLERRVEVLLEDYLAAGTSRAELRERLPFIEERLGARWRGELVRLLDSGRERELAALLLERYYDPLYRHSEARWNPAARIDTSDPRQAAQQAVMWIERRLEPVRA